MRRTLRPSTGPAIVSSAQDPRPGSCSRTDGGVPLTLTVGGHAPLIAGARLQLGNLAVAQSRVGRGCHAAGTGTGPELDPARDPCRVPRSGRLRAVQPRRPGAGPVRFDEPFTAAGGSAKP